MMASPRNSSLTYRSTSRIASVLEERSVTNAPPVRPQASRTETPGVEKETASATLPWFTTKNVTTRAKNGTREKVNSSRLTLPPRLVYTSPPSPTASMYCAVLNHTRIAGLWRTNVSTRSAVTPLTSIAHGWPRIATEARNGMKATEVLTFAKGILKKNESLTMLRSANAATAFQKRDGNGPGGCQMGRTNRHAEANVTAPTRR